MKAPVSMTTVTSVVDYFVSLQKQHKVIERTNMIQNKWDMRDVIKHIDNNKDLKVLIQFYFLYSDEKTFESFFRRYDEYYETMLEVRRERAARRELARRTVEGSK